MSVSSDSGFEVNAVYLEADGQIAKYYFQLTGQGTQLPFILLWRSAVFVIPLWISFSPPVISVVSLTAPITTTQDVEASFSNVPDSVDGRSFAEPAKFMQMYIIKFGFRVASWVCAQDFHCCAHVESKDETDV
ncbi:unnamed protein product [Durusdinium trenchii]|uniref:Uncharacterized protein n=1 Tax=Durusdinium trenchii TaxID=1381693 RepID=A0ABP0J717_9DINO